MLFVARAIETMYSFLSYSTVLYCTVLLLLSDKISLFLCSESTILAATIFTFTCDMSAEPCCMPGLFFRDLDPSIPENYKNGQIQ
jgi:hypothetical protein